jgi:branched-chain amino acid transport system substrate-binding protein
VQPLLLAQKIWEEDVNAKGGLLGRPVKLIYYDDQSNPSTVPGIYTKLLDVDKVDLIIGSRLVFAATRVRYGYRRIHVCCVVKVGM